MGLPMYRDPDEDQIVDEVAAKLDRAAATRRSTIRREPSIRPRDTLTRSQSLARLIRDPRRPASRSQDRTDSRIARLQAELETLRRLRSNMSDIPDRDSPDARYRLTFSNEIDFLMGDEDQDMSTIDNVEPADVVRSHLPRPSRESGLRFEILPSSSSRSSSPWRRRVLARGTIPSPPYSSGSEQRDRSIPDGPLPDDNSMPALTEGFAPARSSADAIQPLDLPIDESQLETPPPEAWESSYPPLRRVRHLSPRPVPLVDGLGDRQRSASAYSDAHEEETWATILTEMNTGSRSDTSTSFASTTMTSTSPTSDLDMRSGSRSDRNFQNASTSFGEIGSGDETCELDLPPGITEEDAREMRAQHHQRHRQDRNSDRDRTSSRRGIQEHRDRVAARIDAGTFRAILERVHRREEIPDELWATIGLSDFARTLD